MRLLLAIVLALVASPVLAQPATVEGVRVQDEGVTKGSSVSTLNCVGAGVTCTVAGSRATLTIPGGGPGGGALPAGSGNELQRRLDANTFGTYPGSSCAAPSLYQALSASGAATCYTLKLNELANPAGDASWAFPSGTKLLYTFTGSTDVAFSIDGDGAFTGTGDLMHVHKSGTGSSFGSDALHVEVTSDTNMTGLRITMPSANATAVNQIGSSYISGNVTSSRFYGPLTGIVTGNVIGVASSTNQLSTLGTTTTVLHGNAAGQPSFAAVNMLADTTADVLSIAKGGSGSSTAPAGAGAVRYATSTTASGWTAQGAIGTILYNSSANTPAWLTPGAAGTIFVGTGTGSNPKYLAAGTAGQVLRSAGAGDPVYVGVQTCTSSAAATCTITVARSGCTPVCGLGGTANTGVWVRGSVSTTTLTCTFSASGTTTCNCLCP